MANKPLFSVVVIMRNESKTIARLAASLKEFLARGGEFIALDTGSTDNSPAIARSVGCTVHEVGEKFVTIITADMAKQINDHFITDGEAPVLQEGNRLFDYTAARNYAASLSTNDVVAMPDCDEIWTKLDIDLIDRSIKSGIDRFEYNFVFAHDDFGNEVIKFMHSKFYNRTKFKWVGIVHEVLTGNGQNLFIDEAHMKLEHFQNPETNRSNYMPGLALDCFLHPENDRNSHYFARELMWHGRPKSAIKEFKRHIAMEAWPPENAQSMIYVGDCYKMMGDEKNAVSWWHSAFDKDASRREALLRLGKHYWEKNDHQHTVAYCSAALTVPWSNFYCNNMDDYQHVPHEYLYWGLWYMGDRAGSKEHWKKALEFRPKHQKYLNDVMFYYQLPPVSIVIPTLGREDQLGSLLQWLHFNTKPSQCEIIIERDSFGDGKVPVDHVGKLTTWANKIKNNENFSFLKVGDGEDYCIAGSDGENCDGSHYDKDFGVKIAKAIDYAETNSDVLVSSWRGDLDVHRSFLHHENNNLADLRQFYGAIRESSRPKVFVGPVRLKGVSELLKTEYISVPLVDAYKDYEEILTLCKKQLAPNAIFLLSSGFCSKPLLADLLKIRKDITVIDAGSAFDPIFVEGPGNKFHDYGTRTQQYHPLVLKEYYRDWLGTPVTLERKGLPKTLKNAVTRANNDLILFLGNDVKPKEGFITHALIKLMDTWSDGMGLVGLNDGFWKNGELATHWLASKKLLPLLGGEFFHTGYNHVGCDNELTERCRNLGRYVWASMAEIDHSTPAQGTGKPMDATYQVAWNEEAITKDRKLLQERSKQFGFKYL